MDDLQFYPTPPELARRAWAKFTRKHFTRVLEPSAGTGALLDEAPWNKESRHWRGTHVDCCEIDLGKHPVLRSKGWNVVGLDFLNMQDGAPYDAIILNPPFNAGATHVLKAYDLLWSGEIVAIVNWETVANPYTKERKRLVALIESCGEVERIEGAFEVEEAQRRTSVDVALIHLTKNADFNNEVIGDFLSELAKDNETGAGLAGDFQEINAVALPRTEVESAVRVFNAAVRSMRDCVFAESRSDYYSNLIGKTMAELNGSGNKETNDPPRHGEYRGHLDWVRQTLGERYDTLKDKAWANLLRSTQVTSRLSSKAQRRLESEFAQIKKLQFDVPTIYGFLRGLIESQGTIQTDMVCDLFDSIMSHGTDNCVFSVAYRGWKSNDKHRAGAMQIRTTRFIIPGHGIESYSSSVSWNTERFLADIDKITAMLDGKSEPLISLVSVFRNRLDELRAGERVSSSYFDVRFYAQAGTIHFFPRDRKIIQRMNLIVGRARQWLPDADEKVPDEFWKAYEMAEKIDKEVRAEINKIPRGRYWWEHPLHKIGSRDHNEEGLKIVEDAVLTVLERKGVKIDLLLGHTPATNTPSLQLPLLAA